MDSIVSAGCIVSGSIVKGSVLSPDVRVNSYSEVDSSILFSHVNVGRHCRIRKAIIDRDVHIPEGTTIGYDSEADRQRYFVTESGITVVTRDYSLFENPVTVATSPASRWCRESVSRVPTGRGLFNARNPALKRRATIRRPSGTICLHR